MFQTLPAELLWDIADYLSSKDICAFSQTCQYCYNAIIPVIYQKVKLLESGALVKLSKKLLDNPDWLHRAQLHVRNLHIVKAEAERTLARYTVFEHIYSGWDNMAFDNGCCSNDEEKKVAQRMDVLVHVMLARFPNLCSVIMDFDVISRGVLPYPSTTIASAPTPLPTLEAAAASHHTVCHATRKSAFHGAVRLYHYRPGYSRLLETLLGPLDECSHLTLQTRPYLSLCAAIQDSLLADSDIDALADLNLQGVRRLDLAYIDDALSFDSFKRLVLSLPHIETLVLEWVLPPSLDYFDRLYRCLADVASLYPDPVQRLNSTYRVMFKYHPPHTAHQHQRRVSVLKH